MTNHFTSEPEPGHYLPTGTAADPAILLDEAGLRDWLTVNADRLGIDDSFSSADLTIAYGLEKITYGLRTEGVPPVWRRRPPLESVLIWPTADDDGVDGGAIVTAELRVNGRPVRLACPHRSSYQFTDDDDICGVDAAVQAMTTVTEMLNHEIASFLQATATWCRAGFVAALNAAADDLLQVADAGDEGMRDAINLTINAAGLYWERGWLTANPAAARDRLEQVATSGYGEDLDTILGWIHAGIL